MDRRTVWRILGIEPTDDAREIRRAYARRLKVTNPEDDAAGFQELRAAYEDALQMAANAAAHAAASEAEDADGTAGPGADGTGAETNYQRDPADHPRPTATPPADEQMQTAAALYEALVAELRRDDAAPDPQALQRALDELLHSPALERFDIYQRAENAVAELLVSHIPRADPLIADTVRHFEWDRREFDRSLPRATQGLLARLYDLEFLDSLPRVDPALARAHQALLNEKPGGRTWLAASLSGNRAELRLLDLLRTSHPNLFAQIPRETVQWWQDFAQQPKPSRGLLVSGSLGTAILASIYSGRADYDQMMPGLLYVVLAGISATLAAVVFKMFGIEWPTLRLQEHWDGDPPPKFALGWLGLAVLALFEAVTAHDAGLFGWLLVPIGMAAWLWALYVSGPQPHGHVRPDILDMRIVRVLLMNGIVLVWLLLLADTPTALTWPGFCTVAFVLLASGFGRPLQMRFYQGLAWRQRLVANGSALGVTLLAVAFTALFARHDAVKPWVVAVAIAITLMRRALPNSIALAGKWYLAVVVVGVGYLVAALATDMYGLDPSALEYPDRQPVVPGALLLLAGAAYSFGYEIFDTLRHRMRGRSSRAAA